MRGVEINYGSMQILQIVEEEIPISTMKVYKAGGPIEFHENFQYKLIVPDREDGRRKK